ncbi:hypothetical protein GCM10007420_02820 [Glycocaulis albus]|jgi:hypothetical protein|uniref:DUF465 domain-containing protein n=2 Tax=Glycocaulis albus TaxID=1382801 RepID=A0ABQ1XEA0_9PROT|nr:hypothetical protein GCM10007420_02820 [Glycocaulis albus]
MSAPRRPGWPRAGNGLVHVFAIVTCLARRAGCIPEQVYWLRMFGDLDEDALIAKLAELRREHRALDAEVRAAQECGVVDQLKLVRLKRRKLMLKDMIFAIEDQLNPDIIA